MRESQCPECGAPGLWGRAGVFVCALCDRAQPAAGERPVFSVVVPVYNSAEILPHLVERLAKVFDGMGHELLTPLIAESPRQWRWWVRLHGRMDDDAAQLESELRRATHRSVEVREATRLPLHALLRACSWHVTGFSTCALEALAFGVLTQLLHPSGEHAYAGFLEQQVMWQHRTVRESRSLLANGGPHLTAACRDAAQRVFANPTSPSLLLGELAV